MTDQLDFLARIAACTKSAELIPVYADLLWAATGDPAFHRQAPAVNAAILSRWKTSTLRTVKQKAWAIRDRRAAELNAGLPGEVS